jgi:hypothetical protein
MGAVTDMEVRRIDDFKGGWFIGDFEPTLLRTSDFEVGWKVHTRDEFIHPHIHEHLVEYNLLAHGEMRVNGRHLKPGDLFIFAKGERVDAEVLTDEAHVVVVKTPSIPSDKVLCEP